MVGKTCEMSIVDYIKKSKEAVREKKLSIWNEAVIKLM